MFFHFIGKRLGRSGVIGLIGLTLLFAAGCRPTPDAVAPAILLAPTATPFLPVETPAPTQERPKLSYVFLFIGDGMGLNQARSVDEALAAQGKAPLCFTQFPVRGEIMTGNASGEVTDSAAAATALATGNKTDNGMLGQVSDGSRRTSIAETLHFGGYGVGILTTVSLDNATPAGFFAHTGARRNYADIAADLFISGFDYFAGGGFHDGADIAALAGEFGYTLAVGDAEADAAEPNARLVVMPEELTSDRGMALAADGDPVRQGQLARNLARGMKRLGANPKGFFFMTEGGRIDLACHYHDAGSLYWETLDLDQAVREAYAFYELHPDETLIVVTADHETGGLTLHEGARGQLSMQRVSCDRFDREQAARFKSEKMEFDKALPEIVAAFGLAEPMDEERDYLETAYAYTLNGKLTKAKAKARYGVYEPITSAAANLVARRAGLAFDSYGHSGVHVPVYAVGRGAEAFSGMYENTAVCEKLTELLALYGA